MAEPEIHQYHYQWPATAAPPPPAPVAQLPVPSANHPPQVLVEDHSNPPYVELRTIFIAGLPDDIKARELQNLLRFLPGYEASQLNFIGGKAIGFALFSTAQLAIAAKDAVRDLLFDAEAKSVLHTEMAKKNLFIKRGIIADPNAYDQSKHLRTDSDSTQYSYSSSPFHTPPSSVWDPTHGYISSTPPPYDPYGGCHVPPVPVPVPAPVPTTPSSYVPVHNIKDNPPCNTLFIGNLGENIDNEELRGLFSAQPGFKQMKTLRQERHTVCFIEFEDVNSAAYVHDNLQGAIIPSSGSVGMRIQYSKNPYGKKKDGSHHQPVPAPPSAYGAQQALSYR